MIRPAGAPRPYRKHDWEGIPAWPSQYLPGQAPGMPRYPAYERCKDCCVTRTATTEDAWCRNPKDERFEPFPYPERNEPEPKASNPWDFERR